MFSTSEERPAGAKPLGLVSKFKRWKAQLHLDAARDRPASLFDDDAKLSTKPITFERKSPGEKRANIDKPADIDELDDLEEINTRAVNES